MTRCSPTLSLRILHHHYHYFNRWWWWSSSSSSYVEVIPIYHVMIPHSSSLSHYNSYIFHQFYTWHRLFHHHAMIDDWHHMTSFVYELSVCCDIIWRRLCMNWVYAVTSYDVVCVWIECMLWHHMTSFVYELSVCCDRCNDAVNWWLILYNDLDRNRKTDQNF